MTRRTNVLVLALIAAMAGPARADFWSDLREAVGVAKKQAESEGGLDPVNGAEEDSREVPQGAIGAAAGAAAGKASGAQGTGNGKGDGNGNGKGKGKK